MKYFLIANNVYLTNEIINSLDIKRDDYVVLFNHQYPMKYDKISNHKNKIIFTRWSTVDLNGISQLKKNYSEFKKIYVVNKYYNDNFSSTVIKNKLNNDDVNAFQIPYKVHSYIKTLNIPSNKSLTTGFYAYIFFNYFYSNSNKIDKIVLVGFDLNYPDGIISSHNPNFELKYYNNELKTNKKLIKVKSSDKNLNDSEISDNYNYNKNLITENFKYNLISKDFMKSNMSTLERIKCITTWIKFKIFKN